MVLSRIYVGDSNGLQFFTEREIGDVDNDGMPEILDPWGNPVEFLRWAPGFTSPAEMGQPGGLSALQGNNPLENWDAFDPMHADGDDPNTNPAVAMVRGENADLFDDTIGNEDIINSNFAMFPLIFSAGPDEDYNIAVGLKGGNGHVPLHYNGFDSVKPDSGYANDPYASFTSSGRTLRMGQVGDNDSKGHIDNITNHIVEAP